MQLGVLTATLRHVIQLKKIEVVVTNSVRMLRVWWVLAAESEVRVGEFCAQ